MRLHEIQHSFRAAILDQDPAVAEHVVSDGIDAVDRLRIYRNTAFSVLADALRLTYPAVERLVGPEFFDAAAATYVRREPPQTAYLTQYGGSFAEFLATLPEAKALPYVSDVARFEWALNHAANAPDASALSAANLASVDPAEHGHLCFAPQPSLMLLRLDHPADTIVDAVLARDDAAMAAIDLADGPVRLAVHRGPDGVEARRLSESEWTLTQLLCDAVPLGSAVARAPVFDAAGLLADHLVRGRFADFHKPQPSA